MSFEKKKKNGSPSICSAILNSPKLHHHHHVCSTNLNIPKLQSSNLFWFFSTILNFPNLQYWVGCRNLKLPKFASPGLNHLTTESYSSSFITPVARGRKNIQQQNMGQQQQLENHKEVEELAGGRMEFHLNFLLVLFCR
jgi:hypothetical protein